MTASSRRALGYVMCAEHAVKFLQHESDSASLTANKTKSDEFFFDFTDLNFQFSKHKNPKATHQKFLTIRCTTDKCQR